MPEQIHPNSGTLQCSIAPSHSRSGRNIQLDISNRVVSNVPIAVDTNDSEETSPASTACSGLDWDINLAADWAAYLALQRRVLVEHQQWSTGVLDSADLSGRTDQHALLISPSPAQRVVMTERILMPCSLGPPVASRSTLAHRSS